MKRDENVEEILRNDLPSASSHEAESAGVRVLERLQMNPGTAASPALLNFDPRRRTNWRRIYALAAAAAIVLAIVLPIAIRSSAPAVLEVAARKVHFGETVKSEMFGEVVKLEDGSRIEMKTNSDLVLERADDGVRIRLDKGDIVVSATKQHGHLYVQTKDVTVSVVGTVFYVKAEKEGSRVAVFEGEVHVKQGQTEKKLGPGDQVTSNPKMESIPVREQVAWSREAVALLPQAPVPAPRERIAFEVATIRLAAAPPPPTPGARGGGGGGLNSRPSPAGCVPDSAGYVTQIDPRRLAIYRTTLVQLVSLAYSNPVINDQNPAQDCFSRTSLGVLSSVPDWAKTDMWDLQATIPEGFISPPSTPNAGGLDGLVARWKQLVDPKLQQMLQTLLAERFNLVIRRETKEMPVYLLKVGKDGPKFNGRSPDVFVIQPGQQSGPLRWENLPPGTRSVIQTGPDGAFMAGTRMVDGIRVTGWTAIDLSMASLAHQLTQSVDRLVVDQTGLKETYNFHFETSGESIGKAIEQFGLRLEESKAPLEVLVIDRAEKPSVN